MTHFFRVRLYGDADAGEPGGGEAVGGGGAGAPFRGAARCALTGPQGSGLVRSLRDADGLAVVPEGVGRVEPGGTVSVLLLPGKLT